ncbi:MAG: ABC transporter permease [Agromyces sp.]
MTHSTGLTASRMRFRMSTGLTTVIVALALILVLSWALAPSSVSPNVLSSLLRFGAVLALVGMGQMLVVQQGGMDLSVPGAVSLAIVVSSQVPAGQDSGIPLAMAIGVAYALVAGIVNGFLVGILGLNSIIATLGMSATLYGVVIMISDGIPRLSAPGLRNFASGATLGVPNAFWVALVALAIVWVLLKGSVAGRRFEFIGANRRAGTAIGLRVRGNNALSFVFAQLLYWSAGFLLAGITAQPTAYMGDNYLLPSVAVVVLGGTSLLGGRGFPLATFLAAFFLKQLDLFVISLGVPFAIQTLVQAAALAVGVSIYTINWKALRLRLAGGLSKSTPAPQVG